MNYKILRNFFLSIAIGSIVLGTTAYVKMNTEYLVKGAKTITVTKEKYEKYTEEGRYPTERIDKLNWQVAIPYSLVSFGACFIILSIFTKNQIKKN